MADAQDLGSCAERREGSSPLVRKAFKTAASRVFRGAADLGFDINADINAKKMNKCSAQKKSILYGSILWRESHYSEPMSRTERRLKAEMKETLVLAVFPCMMEFGKSQFSVL